MNRENELVKCYDLFSIDKKPASKQVIFHINGVFD